MIGPERTLFFNVALKNGHIMSRPRYEPEQEFVGSLVHELQMTRPEFAWVQLIFQNADYSSQLLSLKSYLHSFKKYAETPEPNDGDIIRQRKEMNSEWYRTLELRSRQIDEMRACPTVIMGIQGMWVGEEGEDLKSVRNTLLGLGTFTSCKDDLDSLAVFTYRDPRMLKHLVERRFVVDISEYFVKYAASRMEPPSFMLATEDLGNYIHLPAGSTAGSLGSLRYVESGEKAGEKAGEQEKAFTTFGISSSTEKTENNSKNEEDVSLLPIEDAAQMHEAAAGFPFISKMLQIPQIQQRLDESDYSRLKHLSSNSRRSFEVVFCEGRIALLISSVDAKDLHSYIDLFQSVYGGTDCADEPAVPPSLKSLAQDGVHPTGGQTLLPSENHYVSERVLR